MEMKEEKTMMVIKYCPACGAKLDEEGICTREACARRKLQIKAKEKASALQAEKNEKKEAEK